MKHSHLVSMVFGVAVAAFLPVGCTSGDGMAAEGVTGDSAADTVLVNGEIYTVDANRTWAEAVAVTGGRIVYVGDGKGIDKYIGDGTEVIDLEGKMVLPAFVDAHMHPAMSAVVYLFQASLYDVFTHEEYIAVIREFAAGHPELAGILGAGFMRAAYDEVGPRKEWLDEIDSQRPIAITSVDGHSTWVNSRALELALITKDTPDPEGGVIKRDPVTGEPSGLLQESAAGLVTDLFPKPTKDQYKEGLLWLQEWFNSVGLTTAHDALVTLSDPDYYMAYQELAEQGLLTMRFRGSWSLAPDMGSAYGERTTGEALSVTEAIERGLELSGQFNTPYWKVHSFKFFADQVIEEETGYLSEPYAHRDDGWQGIKVWDDQVLADAFMKIDKAGYQIHVHQIGDAAATYTLSALEAAEKANGKRDSRHSFAHVQMLSDSDILRAAKLGLSLHTAPYWQIVDDYYWDLYLPYLGPERANFQQYPMKSLFDAGINVTIHSDFFVTEPDLGWAFYSAVTRTMPQKIFEMWYGEDSADMIRTTDPDVPLDYYMMGPLGPADERCSLEQAVAAATINGARANFLDDEIGSIEAGKSADLIVLDRNLFVVDIEEVAEFEVLMTFFEGKQVYVAE